MPGKKMTTSEKKIAKLTAGQKLDLKYQIKQLRWILENCQMKEPHSWHGKETTQVTRSELAVLTASDEWKKDLKNVSDSKDLDRLIKNRTRTVQNWLKDTLMEKRERDIITSYFELESDFFERGLTDEEKLEKQLKELRDAILNNPNSYWSSLFGEYFFSPNDDQFEMIKSNLSTLIKIDPHFRKSIENPKSSADFIDSLIVAQRFLDFTYNFWFFFKDHISALQNELIAMDEYYYQEFGIPLNDIERPRKDVTVDMYKEKNKAKKEVANKYLFAVDCNFTYDGQPELKIYTKKRYDPKTKHGLSKSVNFDENGNLLVKFYDENNNLINTKVLEIDKTIDRGFALDWDSEIGGNQEGEET